MSEAHGQRSADIVIADIHGRVDLMEAVRSSYPDSFLLFAGDVISRSGAFGSVSESVQFVIDDENSAAISGNHEPQLLAAMCNLIDQKSWARSMLKKPYTEATLRDYDVTSKRSDSALRIMGKLRSAMAERGHISFLRNLGLYHEAEDYIAVHAGLEPDVKLNKQLQRLRRFGSAMQNDMIPMLPNQITSHALAAATKGHPDTKKTIVSGHASSLDGLSAKQRLTNNGKRARLAHKVWDSDHIYIWDNSKARVKKVSLA